VSGGNRPDATVVSDLRQGDGELSFLVSGPLGEHPVRFWGDIPENSAGPPVEPALAAVLLAAMTTGGELSLPGPLSPRLRRALPDLQAVLEWIAAECPAPNPPLRPVSIQSPPGQIEAPSTAPSGVGVFFSGGVDSWLTLLANPDVTDLIYVHGFDIPIDEPEVSATVERRLADAAERCGKRLRVVRTDLRTLLDPCVSWEVAHGPALATIALLLSPVCGRVLIGSTTTYAELAVRGSHPLHDHLWSTEGCRIEHCGAHLTRTQKLEQVAECQDALDVLRVCWRHVDRYNCGSCEKCLRTMVALEALGALERCPAFAVPLDLDAVANLRLSDDEAIWWRENLELGRRRNAPTALLFAIEACLSNEAAQAADGEMLAREQLHEVIESRSWQITAPFRRLGSWVRRSRERVAPH
jgi:hypothetical protein